MPLSHDLDTDLDPLPLSTIPHPVPNLETDISLNLSLLPLSLPGATPTKPTSPNSFSSSGCTPPPHHPSAEPKPPALSDI